MGVAFITRRGGGAPLNFKVVGGTKPSNPKENTILVSNPNLLDFNKWANSVGVVNGSKIVSGNAIHLTSDGNGDCYTMFYGEGTTMIPCTPGKTYVMEWEHSGDAGYVYFFGTSGQMVNTHSSSRKLEYIPGEGETQFAFRFGVSDPNVTATYSNIRITEKMAEITGWHFGAEEPNVYDIKTISPGDLHWLICPHKLSAGDIVNFTIPATVSGVYEALRIYDGSRFWYVRDGGGTAPAVWSAGTKIGLRITETNYPIGEWGSTGEGSALIYNWGDYYHQEGTVWIQTGTTSPVAMNVLKKNSIQVCPLTAKQYVGGAWADKTAQSYQGGAWVDWIHPDIAKIYNLQEVRENGTGGATVTIGKEMVLTTTSAGSAQGYVAFYSAEKIDLTNYSKLTFKGSRSSFGQAFMVGFRTANTRYWNWGEYADDIAASVRVEPTEATYSVDVSSLNGSYYFFANFAGQASAGTATMNLSNFELT